MVANASGRRLECECGYVAHGADDDELVADAQAHAQAVHGMTLSAELIMALADTKAQTTIRRTVVEGDPDEAVSLDTEQRLR